MAALRQIVLAALCAGILSGAFATAAHQVGTVPVILNAEAYEKAATHSSLNRHEDAASTWQPEKGMERTAYTFLADVLTGIGFALLLAAGLTLRGGEITWRDGLFWGLAGFAAFTLAPSLGLPPQVPGTDAAPLVERQLWWVATAVSTASALALFSFTKRAPWAILAAVLIVLPHLYGAPQPTTHGSGPLEGLARHFAVTVTIISFLFWAILGASTGYFYCRFRPSRA
jgi:cobalt transporter subunit CbtA